VIDKKITCFGVSLDGEAAFPSVDRDILVRDLYSVGESGDYLQYSRCTYQNTQAQFKLDGKLSRTFVEHTGNRQGHVKASGNFKAYINPCLDSLNSTYLGFHIGSISVGVVCCTDDSYLLSDRPSGVQSSINIGRVSVVTDNEHVGLMVSGADEEQKNADRNIAECRKSLFGLLGPALSYKCKLSPLAQLHLWTVYSLPVLRSGLSALPIRPTVMKSLTIFHNKILRGFLKLSNSSPVPALYFLLGELPIEARLHIDLLTLFHNIISNPETKLSQIVKYILMMSDDKSTTWSKHVSLICRQYQLPDPLKLLQSTPIPRAEWKTLIVTKITAHHERNLREKAAANSNLQYLNVQLLGLSGRSHPVLHHIYETREAFKLRAHLQLLSGNFASYELIGKQRSSDPGCRLCPTPIESTQHILSACCATADVRERLLPELLNLISEVHPTNGILDPHVPKSTLTQFILDPTSFNLSNKFRIPFRHTRLHEIFRLCHDWCYAVTSSRKKQLDNMNIR
jgi:hypothetical protein